MTLDEIDTLIAEIKDDFDLPVEGPHRDHLQYTAKRTDIPMKDCWAAEEVLRMDKVWRALTALRQPPNTREKQS